MGTKLLFFCCVAFCSLLSAATALVSFSEAGIVHEFNATSPAHFRSLDGVTFPGLSGELVFCSRVRFSGRSRILDAYKFAHAVNLKIEQEEALYRPSIHVCVQRNASAELCECPKESWKPLQKGKWSALRSPFETLYLDVKTVDSYTDTSFVATATEEFHAYHLVFLVAGFALLLLSGTLSSWVPFYYSSAMTLGVLLVVLILLYQGMRLLPTGRKSTLYILVYGSLVGLGTVVIHYLTGVVSSALYQLGLGDDMLNPLVMFFVLGIVVMGAWLGYWGVRKLVLSEDGRVDIGTAHFVKWTLRLLGSAMLLQSSRDDFFAVLLMGLGWLACWGAQHLNLNELDIFNFERPEFYLRRSTLSYSKKRRHSEFLRNVWSRSPIQHNVKVSSSGGSPKTPNGRVNINKDQDFYSSYHNTPGRKPLSKEELEELKRTCTRDALKDLLASPDFANWAISQADRIIVTPTELRDERPEEEIEMTAYMEQEEVLTTPTRPVRKKTSRYT